ncbi:hypothetical protein MASR2M15_10150 [Anaerolineales bacterium]
MYKTLFLTLMFLFVSSVFAIEDDDFPPAIIENDEGGTRVIMGEVAYSSPFFTDGVSEPIILLEDQAGFVARNEGFLMPVESQVLGQITSDFYASPFTYSITLPMTPEATLVDVDQDGEEDTGIMVYAIAYWSNVYGDPYLEERDLYGGGWSSAYVSTRVSASAETVGEIYGGKLLVYAPDDQQGFPSDFGEDGFLFTEDDPIVRLPQGYTLVDLDTTPFSFDRSNEITVDLFEGESAYDDWSELSFIEGFDNLIAMMREEYAFTVEKNVDWDALEAEFRPRFEQATTDDDIDEYLFALRDFTWSISDGHHSTPLVGSLVDRFVEDTDGGLGIAIMELDDGRVIVNYLLEDSPAAEAGIELGAEILEINGQAITDVISEAQPWSRPFSTEHVLRLQQLRYAVRFPMGTTVELLYKNPGADETTSSSMEVINERESFSASSFNLGRTGYELPVEFELLDSGYVYVKLDSFSDNDRLEIDLWERLMRLLNYNAIEGLIIDMRQNGGGSSFLSAQMAAYFFDEEYVLGAFEYYDRDLRRFYSDPDTRFRFYLPSDELHYDGKIAVLVGPNCNSACEYFTYYMTIDDRAAIVGQYPTAGLGGGQKRVTLPGGLFYQFSVSRLVDESGNLIPIEGVGIIPTVKVPITEETVLTDEDVVLQAAIDYLNGE